MHDGRHKARSSNPVPIAELAPAVARVAMGAVPSCQQRGFESMGSVSAADIVNMLLPLFDRVTPYQALLQ